MAKKNLEHIALYSNGMLIKIHSQTYSIDVSSSAILRLIQQCREFFAFFEEDISMEKCCTNARENQSSPLLSFEAQRQ